MLAVFSLCSVPCAVLAVLLAAPLRAQLPDIRGNVFDLTYSQELGGAVLDNPLIAVSDSLVLDPLSGTFDVLPNPADPDNPSSVLIRTRLPMGPDDPNKLLITLQGHYNPATGELTAVGSKPGTYFYETVFTDNGLGLLPGLFPVWITLVDPTLKLHGVVKLSANGEGGTNFLILGADDPPLFGAPGNLTLAAGVTIAWLPPGASTPSEALLGPFPVSLAYGAIYHWRATFRSVFGDLTGDGLVADDDLIALLASLGTCPSAPSSCPGDLDADGDVDQADANFLMRLIQQASAPGG